jgi:hypothetical protein
MLYFCPCCNNKTVTWDPRCLHFVCLSDSCHQAFPLVRLVGVSDEDSVRFLNLNKIPNDLIQNWISGCSECNEAPVQPSEEAASSIYVNH